MRNRPQQLQIAVPHLAVERRYLLDRDARLTELLRQKDMLALRSVVQEGASIHARGSRTEANAAEVWSSSSSPSASSSALAYLLSARPLGFAGAAVA
jgi:hypothetical protein